MGLAVVEEETTMEQFTRGVTTGLQGAPLMASITRRSEDDNEGKRGISGVMRKRGVGG